MEKLLVNKNYLLEKYPGKGGWTYAIIPDIRERKPPFGWLKVKGSIDSYQLKGYRLMPLGNGKLFLPVKLEVRKKIAKNAGEYVHVVLYADDDPLEIPEELSICLKDEPLAYKIFSSYSEGEQKAFVDWITSAKRPETKADRIGKTVDMILKGKKITDSI
jgi:hypothetical protein